ncbi:hypothetical protein TREES_T100005344 [Tupaia chinensis]|uniref:Uncharacterized protein n=1 Tax=Tupaia chinensis TaxID=246437 RepID=L9KS34_TUPCH|nr:hypothetical protein TREES_T100005344 [Tupaia chinensis]
MMCLPLGQQHLPRESWGAACFYALTGYNNHVEQTGFGTGSCVWPPGSTSHHGISTDTRPGRQKHTALQPVQHLAHLAHHKIRLRTVPHQNVSCQGLQPRGAASHWHPQEGVLDHSHRCEPMTVNKSMESLQANAQQLKSTAPSSEALTAKKGDSSAEQLKLAT